MEWDEFYERFYASENGWAESTARSRISSLKSFGCGAEVVDIAVNLPTEAVRAQLIRKAMKYNVVFDQTDYMLMDGDLPWDVYEELGKYAGFDANDPYFDEDNITWDTFRDEYEEWDDDILLKRIKKLKSFGPKREVVTVIDNMPNIECEEALKVKVFKEGVIDENFFKQNSVFGSIYDISTLTEETIEEFVDTINELSENVQKYFDTNNKPVKKRRGCLGSLFALWLTSDNGEKKGSKRSGRCDGDCANCPPHYGYRYGRWYYGHNHIEGCERGGNSGSGGRD